MRDTGSSETAFFTIETFINDNRWGWIVDSESRRGRGPLSAWRVSFAEKANPAGFEATRIKSSPTPTREYNSNPDEGSVPCPFRIGLNEDERGLALRYLPMAHQLAQRMCAVWPAERDELESTAYLALAEAAQAFDSSRKVGFGTFARHRIRAALRDLQRLLSLDSWPRPGEAGPVRHELSRFHNRVGQGRDAGADQSLESGTEEARAIDGWLEQLPTAHAAVCRFIYQGGKSESDVAIELGCSKSMLSRLHREAITGLIRAYHYAHMARPHDSAGASD
jgi:RNA polymerase sigma factor (sigma-70 family)